MLPYPPPPQYFLYFCKNDVKNVCDPKINLFVYLNQTHIYHLYYATIQVILSHHTPERFWFIFVIRAEKDFFFTVVWLPDWSSSYSRSYHRKQSSCTQYKHMKWSSTVLSKAKQIFKMAKPKQKKKNINMVKYIFLFQWMAVEALCEDISG